MGFKFIDLCCGIGAFHLGLKELGGTCVYAVEKDKKAAEVYKKNFNIDPLGDIFEVNEKDIPEHDLLCMGFPCQAFSVGGHKGGFEDARGTLFFEGLRILKYHRTKYLFLENVKNLVYHDNGRTWEVIKNSLKGLGYVLTEEPIVLSPHQLGLPQKRERVFILGVHKSICNDSYLDIDLNIDPNLEANCSVYSVLDKEVDPKYNIKEYEKDIIASWEKVCVNLSELPSHIWSDEFGANYDINEASEWKRGYIKESRDFYEKNKEFLDKWLKEEKISTYNVRERKLEWQVKKYGISSIYDTVIQFRQSGIRCKAPNYFPTLLAIAQTPVIAKYQRRLTPRECARLQSFPDWFVLDKKDTNAYKQIGNSINVDVVKCVAQGLKKYGLDIKSK